MRILTLLAILLQTSALFAQLDTIHWLPPMHAREDWGPQYLYLSTPETQPFEVSIRDGSGALVASATISNAQPFAFFIGSSNSTQTLVTEAELQKALTGKGLVMDGPKPFYAYFRTRASSQRHAGDLTCKGRAALGKNFRVGHLLQAEDDQSKRSNFIGMMATEDSTVISLSDFNPGVKFRVNSTETTLVSPVKLTLNKGECAVISQYIQSNASIQPPNGLMGALLQSSKPIAVNTGSWLGAPIVFMAYDIGIDQIVPVELVGKEYILCRGNGSEALEHPIIVAHFDNTAIFINGSQTPVTTLSAGDYYSVPTSQFSVDGNMYVRSSEPVFMYQMIGGTSDSDDQYRTAGLIFVPPLSCGIPNAVDNIYLPNQIGDMRFEGGMMITAMRDSIVVLRVDGVMAALGVGHSVPGNPDFVTYRPLSMFDQQDNPQTISVKAHGAVQVALFGRNEPASFAGFFSGFTKTDQPKLNLSLLGDGVCPDTLVASGHFDGVQWMYGDSILQYGPDTMFTAYAPGQYIAVGYLGVCRRTDFAADTVEALFNSPEFPYAFSEPSCYGFADGEIEFGTPSGGIAPYQFSVDKGKTFSTQPHVAGLTAGVYNLVARDSTGCYNRPLQIEIGQPDSFAVHLTVLSLPDPLYPEHESRFKAVPDRPVVRSEWSPADSSGCIDCLEHSLFAKEDTWLSVTVYDSAGCPATDKLLVEVTPYIYVPNAFQPNSTGGNDVFTVFSREAIRVKRLSIYDRWGELVFEKTNFNSNEPASGWDGTFRGKPMNPGVFVWRMEVELTVGKMTVLFGDVSLLR